MLNGLRKLQARATAAAPMTVQEEKAVYIKFYADVTKAWSGNLPVRGRAVAFSPENAFEAYRTVHNLYRAVNAFLLKSNTEAAEDFTAA